LEFQEKARRRMQSLMSSARAVIVVSHDLPALALMCDRVLWLEHGRVQTIGPTAEVIAAYTDQIMQNAQRRAA
jgi:ABC-type polysaccharide/polyol phosphate transport system ATPase subunit